MRSSVCILFEEYIEDRMIGECLCFSGLFVYHFARSIGGNKCRWERRKRGGEADERTCFFEIDRLIKKDAQRFIVRERKRLCQFTPRLLVIECARSEGVRECRHPHFIDRMQPLFHVDRIRRRTHKSLCRSELQCACGDPLESSFCLRSDLNRRCDISILRESTECNHWPREHDRDARVLIHLGFLFGKNREDRRITIDREHFFHFEFRSIKRGQIIRTDSEFL